jgi:hypothetical protein
MRPFGGPEAVLAYLSRYTHRVAISNRRLIAADADTVTFSLKDYRVEGPDRYRAMTLATGEFIRRFLMHVLPSEGRIARHDARLCAASVGAVAARAYWARTITVGIEAPNYKFVCTALPTNSIGSKP